MKERNQPMPSTICFANMKGGVGKTTLCVNLAFELFLSGKRVLVVDNDPQFNATSSLVSPKDYIDICIKKRDNLTVYEIYEKPPRVRGVPSEKPDPKKFFWGLWYMTHDLNIVLHLIPSAIELYETLANPSQKEYLLDKFLKKHADKYDYILIDCPPTPSVLTTSAFAASDYVVIPVTPDYYSTIGLPQFFGTLKDFKDKIIDPHDVKAIGVVFTNVPRQISPDTQKSMDRVRKTLKNSPLDVPIFSSKMSHFKVYQKALWQSVPVRKISGRGTRGKGLAVAEVSNIEQELDSMIQTERQT